ncbi:alpha/beta fold hydrolase [Ktedonospora formicarum]|uniref:Alpha/beta hydrolase n=1 Tax=Ktedonospora formicarum TaxID=2778364 RepID=A0A8J3HUI7_9CHLR|nr:alpha/beta hydrolase [Ktedonospora formicarum]GHO44267.1 alpha/beta hydrolase [Ktedonospora formicarum]
MKTVTSRDGTPIAFDQSGHGPVLILVTGALTKRVDWTSLAAYLSLHFSVLSYDRRGRGESGDKTAYAIEREIEDLDTLIAEVGGPAFVFGHSSGGALALEATAMLGSKIAKLAIYEVPYNSEDEAKKRWIEYRQQLTDLLAANRRGDAVKLFMRLVGMPADQIEAAQQTPMWLALEMISPTLAYDAAVLGSDGSIPIERAMHIHIPTLVMSGGASYSFMDDTARALSNALPQAQYRKLEGQNHAPANDVLALALKEFFLD